MPEPFAEPQTLADLLQELGDISPSRIRLRPAPGRATEKDVIRIEAQENRLYELVDGVLVEFEAGCRLAWIIDPKTRTADVYTASDECRHLRPSQSLDGGDVLPGFKLSLKDLFASTRRRSPRRS